MNARAEEPIKPSGKLRRGFPPDCVARDRETMKYIERVIGLPRLLRYRSQYNISCVGQAQGGRPS